MTKEGPTWPVSLSHGSLPYRLRIFHHRSVCCDSRSVDGWHGRKNKAIPHHSLQLANWPLELSRRIQTEPVSQGKAHNQSIKHAVLFFPTSSQVTYGFEKMQLIIHVQGGFIFLFHSLVERLCCGGDSKHKQT